MAQVGALTEFTTGQTPIPSASMNANFAALKAGINSIDQTQIAAGSTICLSTAATEITGVYTFTANPVFNAGAIDDSYLSSNVPLLDDDNTFTGDNTFDEPIIGFKFPELASHPTLEADDGKAYKYTGDGHYYVFEYGTGAVRLDYEGAYTGGAVRSYHGSAVTDENTPIIIPIKCDVGFTAGTLNLIGLGFPSYIYTELPAHTHSVGTLTLSDGTILNTSHTHSTDIGHTHSGTFASLSHTHQGGYHTHDIASGTAVSDGQHDHGGQTGLSARQSVTDEYHSHPITAAGTHTHTVTGWTTNERATTGSPSATASVSSYSGSKTSGTPTYGTAPSVATTITGSTASAGITGNTLNDTIKEYVTTAIKVYITDDMSDWGTALDSGTLAALANINTSGGTGDINIFSYLAEGYNYIKIVDETAKTGGTIAWHAETS